LMLVAMPVREVLIVGAMELETSECTTVTVKC
jgi:hypothetical protein